MNRLRKITALTAALVLSLAMAVAGCAKLPEEPASSDPTLAVSDTAAEESSTPSSGQDEPPAGESEPASEPAEVIPEISLPLYDETMDHQILVADIGKQTLLQIDMDLCGGDFKNLTSDDCIVWEWNANEDPNCHHILDWGLDDAKYRYSDYWERDVIIACSSNGWAGVIDYEAKTILWESTFDNCPHSVEMLPGGDLLVAGSGGDGWETEGELVLIPLSQGVTTETSALHVPSCHGVQWDPERELSWVLGYYGVIGVRVAEDGSLQRVDGVGAEFGSMDGGGHDLSPVYGEPDKYWVTAHHRVWQFDAADSSLTYTYDRFASYSKKDVKGIAYFPDGTMVSCVGGLGFNLHASWSTKALSVTYFPEPDGKAVSTAALFDDREFYKVRTFTGNYHSERH